MGKEKGPKTRENFTRRLKKLKSRDGIMLVYLRMEVHIYKLSTQEASQGSLLPGRSGLQNKTCLKTRNEN